MTRIDARRVFWLLAIPGALLFASCGGAPGLISTATYPIGDGDDIRLVVRDFMIDGSQKEAWGYYSYLLIAAGTVDRERAQRQRAAANAFMCSYVDAQSTERPRETLAVFYAPVSTPQNTDSAAAYEAIDTLRSPDSDGEALLAVYDHLAADELLTGSLGQQDAELAIATYPLAIGADTILEKRLLTFIDLSNSPPDVVVEVIEALRTTIRQPTRDLERLHSRRYFTALLQEGLELIGRIVTLDAHATGARETSRLRCRSTGE